jgi:hypothetical protein
LLKPTIMNLNHRILIAGVLLNTLHRVAQNLEKYIVIEKKYFEVKKDIATVEATIYSPL